MASAPLPPAKPTPSPPHLGYSRLVGVMLTAILVAMTLTAPARADDLMIDTEAGVGIGLEGGTPPGGSFGFRRSRLRLQAGADLRSDGNEHQAWGFRVFSEIEGRGTLGVELRHVLLFSKLLSVHGGGTFVLVPETLLGIHGGARFVLPLFGKDDGLYFEGSLHALPLGGDLPERGGVVVWTLASVGVHLGI